VTSATRSTAALAAVVALAAAGCTATGPGPTPTPTPSAAGLTVVTTEVPATFDPAASTTAADALVALNAFSRLMVVHPEGAELKPDLATDCLYTSPVVYECLLPEDLAFHNGHALTASDVKFSIERAYRLNVPRSSVHLLDSLQRVDVVDDQTVRFTLRWADSQFGYALATPAASIVDEEIYDPDAVRPNTGQAGGSGPYRLVTTADDHLVFELNTSYRGAMGGTLPRVRVAFVPDSAAAEAAMADASADVVWRSLTPAALARLEAEADRSADGRTSGGFTAVDLPGVRVQRLVWHPGSPHRADAALRGAVAAALQADRSLPSLIPPGVAGSVASFPVGGQPEVPALGGQRLRLTLAYSSRAPGQRDLAGLLRDRLEGSVGVSVQLVADTFDADLVLTDRPAWVNTAFGWLQPYVDEALPDSAPRIDTLMQQARETTDATVRAGLLAEVQQQSAVDLTVLPIAQGPETLYLGSGVRLEGQPFGPAWQLGLWSLRT